MKGHLKVKRWKGQGQMEKITENQHITSILSETFNSRQIPPDMAWAQHHQVGMFVHGDSHERSSWPKGQ